MAFVCETCRKSYAQKRSLLKHQKTHDGTQFSCGKCNRIFTQRDCLVRHIMSVHGFVKYTREFNDAMRINGVQIHDRVVKTAVAPSARSDTVMTIDPPSVSTTAFTSAPTAVVTAGTSLPSVSSIPVSRKRPRGGNGMRNIARKTTRLQSVNTPGFIEINASLRRGVVWYYRRNVDNNIISYRVFLDSIKSELITRLRDCLRIGSIKYNLKLEATYHLPSVEKSFENRAFKSPARELFVHSDIAGMVDEDFSIILAEEDVYAGKGSGFTLSCIDGMLLGVYEFEPINGSSYIELPKNIVSRRAVINPQNIDQQCFKWAILAKHVSHDSCKRVGKNYHDEEYRYDFSALSIPTPVSEIKLFECYNRGTSVNVYGLRESKKFTELDVVFPLRVTDEERENHFDLLLVNDAKDTTKSHYSYISNFSRLVRTQKTSYEHKIYTCKRCFSSFDDRPRKYQPHGREALAEHMKMCGPHKPILPVMPREGDILKFEGWCKSQNHPFVIYADFEALLRPTDQQHGQNTLAFQQHHAMSYGFVVKAADHVPVELLERFEIPRQPVIYRGSASEDAVAREFVLSVVGVVGRIRELLTTVNVPIAMSEEQRVVHEATSRCQVCDISFSSGNWRTMHHCHLTGKFLASSCNNCNLKLKTPNFVPCFLHNLSRYDAHFIVTELGYDEHRISVIPNSEENYVSFTKYIDTHFSVRFVDSCRFMASSLASLAKNLVTEDFSKFGELKKVFSATDMPLVTRKGVYPYEYTDDWDKLREMALPARQEFYSSLTESHVDNEDYEHAQRVWDHFGCRTLGDYSDLYLKIDVLLLADVFENFRRLCFSTYNLDPAYYYTAPGFTFDCMLKYTRIRLELVTDYEQLLMLEAGIRGGLVQATKRYARANNAKTPGYDDELVKTSLVYLDCNNLYGWAMSQYMPYGGFSWYTGNPEVMLAQLEMMGDTDHVGRIFDVDISYPRKLHDLFRLNKYYSLNYMYKHVYSS